MATTGGFLGVNRLRESAGPTALTIGAVADGEYLQRSGSTVVGGEVMNAYDAVIPDTHTTLGAAVAAGKTNIFVRNGAHAQTTSVTLPSYISITGESTNAIIDFSSTSAQLTNTASTEYSTGTVALASGSDVVTGTGTSWNTSSIASGDVMIIGEGYLTYVVSVDNASTITIDQTFRRSSVSGLSYVSFTPQKVALRNLGLYQSTGNPLTLSHLVASSFVRLSTFDTGNWALTQCHNTVISESAWNSLGDRALSLTDCSGVLFTTNIVAGTSGLINISTTGYGIIIANSQFTNSSGPITLDAECRRISVVGNIFRFLQNNGLQLNTGHTVQEFKFADNYMDDVRRSVVIRASVYQSSVTDNIITNGTNAIVIETGNSTGLNITGNQLEGSSDIIQVTSDLSDSNISGNSITGQSSGSQRGIELIGSRNTITANVIKDCGAGIYLSGNSDNNVISSNSLYDNDDGLDISAATCDVNLVVGNSLVNNTTPFTDSGTGTVTSANLV